MSELNRVSSFRDLIAWQKGMTLVTQVYQFTKQLPADERYSLSMQMRRCSVSIPSNIAEGWGRDTKQDYLRFLQMARGSLHELSTQAELCQRLQYLGEWSTILRASDEVGRILNGLITSIRKSSRKRKSDPTPS